MVSRRELLSGSALGLTGLGGAATGTDQGAQEVDLRPVLNGLRDLRDEMLRNAPALAVSREVIAQIRRAQKQHFRVNGRFPVWIEVGVDVWECVYDWHIRNQQPLTVGRDSGGRYTIAFFFSTLIGRSDVEPSYMGAPYDER